MCFIYRCVLVGDYFLQVGSGSVGSASVTLDSDSIRVRVSGISVISTVSKMLYPVKLNDLNYVVRD